MSLADSTKMLVITARLKELKKIDDHLNYGGWSPMAATSWLFYKDKERYACIYGLKNGITVELFQETMLAGDWRIVRRRVGGDGSPIRRDTIANGYGLDKLIEELARRGV